MCAGAIVVHDLSKKDKNNFEEMGHRDCNKWNNSAPLANGSPGGLPVPFLVNGNKADVAAKEGTKGSSGNLVDMAHQWVEKQVCFH